MPLPLLLAVPAAVAAALIAFVKIHSAHIAMRAAMAAVEEYLRSRDADRAADAAVRAGASAATGDVVGDFFRAKF
jgi:hypothetical protein